MNRSFLKNARTKARNEQRRAQRRAVAEARQAQRDKRTDQEQLELLDWRFGKGKGAEKERAKLSAKIKRE